MVNRKKVTPHPKDNASAKTGDKTKTKTGDTKKGGTTLKHKMRQVHRAIWGFSDKYLESLTRDLLKQYQLSEALQELEQAKGKYHEQRSKDLGVIDYAFALLRKEYPGLDFTKVNPHVVVSWAREALANNVAGDALGLKRFKNKVSLMVIREMMAEKNALIARANQQENQPMVHARRKHAQVMPSPVNVQAQRNNANIKPSPTPTLAPNTANDVAAKKKREQAEFDKKMQSAKKRRIIAEDTLQKARRRLKPTPGPTRH